MLAILGGVGAAFAGGRRRACTGSAAERRPAGRVDPAPGAPGGRARGRPLPLVVAGRLTLTRAALPFVLVSGVCEVLGFVSYTVGAYLVLNERLAPTSGAGRRDPRGRRGAEPPAGLSGTRVHDRGGAGYVHPMPRSIWNGTIAFGLMTVPVKLHTATDPQTVSFREVHLDDGAHIEHRRFCSKEDKEVPYKQVVKGYEVAEDKYVVLEKDEIAAAAGGRGKRIEVEHFVDAADIDPIFYEKTYYLGAGKDGEQPYRLLLEALSRTGRAGIGRFTFHDREYLTAVRARDGVLVLHTLRFADELVTGDEIDVPAPGRGPGDREVKMAAQLIDTLYTEFDPADHEDEYRAAVLAVVERKRKGEPIVPEEEPEADEAPDLMATLKASLDGAKKGGR